MKNEIKVNVGDKVGIKSCWDGKLRMEVIDIRDGEMKVKVEFDKYNEPKWVSLDELVEVLPKWDFFPHNFVPFEEKVWRVRVDFFRVERAMSKLRHEFAKEFKNPLVGWWEVWGNKAINAIKENGRDGLFNFFRKFAKVVIENIRKEEELEAILAHNLKHVKGYSVEEFNEELKKEIIHNINNSFEYVNADTFEAAGCVKYAYKNWDEFYEILKEGFEDYINENF